MSDAKRLIEPDSAVPTRNCKLSIILHKQIRRRQLEVEDESQFLLPRASKPSGVRRQNLLLVDSVDFPGGANRHLPA